VWVESVHLTDVRSYVDAQVDLGPGITTFVGRNGQGKTNIVEAIGFLATLGSHRVASDQPMIRRGARHAVIRARVVDQDRRTSVDLAISHDQPKKARINQSPVTRVRDILGIIHTVLFAPEDLAIVKGDPGDRRTFLDDFLIQYRPAYAGVRADYDRVLKQRNALLKSARQASRSASGREAMLSTLDVWNDQLADIGSQIIYERCLALQRMTPFFMRRYADLADGAEAQLRYVSKISDDVSLDREGWRTAFLTAIAERTKEEIDRGITLVGPQRDDIMIELHDFPAKGYASHGESWSLALALRLACADVFNEHNRSPVLILDDVFAELDSTRRERLAQAIHDHEQVLITAAVLEDVPELLHGDRIRVHNGTLVREVQ
jgi:DNA replication and repair protein RecF